VVAGSRSGRARPHPAAPFDARPGFASEDVVAAALVLREGDLGGGPHRSGGRDSSGASLLIPASVLLAGRGVRHLVAGHPVTAGRRAGGSSACPSGVAAPRLAGLFACLVVLLLVGCARNLRTEATGEEGEASWYGPGLYGRKTASGEVLKPGTMTAAHRTLPFGTCLRVTNLDNGRAVEVRVNDRGPYAAGRILDVSETAARALGMHGRGVTRVRLERCPGRAAVDMPPLEAEPDAPVARAWIQDSSALPGCVGGADPGKAPPSG